LPTDTDVSNAQTAAQNYANANDDSGTDDQTLQQVTDQGDTTTADITANSFTGDGSALTDVDATQLGGNNSDFFFPKSGGNYKMIAGDFGPTIRPNSAGAYVDDGFARGTRIENLGADQAVMMGSFGNKKEVFYGYFGVVPKAQNSGFDYDNVFRAYPTFPAWGEDEIFHEGNDGVGSGLDADKLGGADASSYLDSKWTESGGNISRNSRVSIGTASTSSTDALYIEGSGSGPSARTGFLVKNTADDGAANFAIQNNVGQGFLTQVSTDDYSTLSDAIGLMTTNNGLDMVLAAGGGSLNAGTGDIRFRLGGYGVSPQFTMKVESSSGNNRRAFFGVNESSPVYEIDVNGTVNATDFIGDGSGLTDVNAELLGGQNGSYYEKLTQDQVDDFADNNGYLKSEVDGSVTNEIQTLQQVTDQQATTTADITANSFIGGGSALIGVNAFKLDGEEGDYYTQTLDVSTLVGTKLNLSLSNDGQFTKEINLNPIITRGISGSSGSSNASTGGAGVYTITHNFGAVATAISCNARGATFYHVQVTSSGTNSFTVKIFNADGSQETTATNIILDSILTFK
jgi:hypothetical protein